MTLDDKTALAEQVLYILTSVLSIWFGTCRENRLHSVVPSVSAIIIGNTMRLFEGTPLDRPPRCERCDELERDCTCPPAPPTRLDPKKQTAQLFVEKRKKGKVVTVVRGLSAEGNDLAALLGKPKSACGAGGTLNDEGLEIQGKHRERIRELLIAIGYRVRD